jgi:hypothetical protein
MSSFLLMWILYDGVVALVINIILGLFLYFFVRNGYDLYDMLYVTDEEATSNSLKKSGNE